MRPPAHEYEDGATKLSMNLVAADVRRLYLKFLKRSQSLLTSAATVRGFNTRTSRGILPVDPKIEQRTPSREPQMEEPALSIKLSTSSPRPSPPSAMEERVAEGRERRRLAVQTKVRIPRGFPTRRVHPA